MVKVIMTWSTIFCRGGLRLLVNCQLLSFFNGVTGSIIGRYVLNLFVYCVVMIRLSKTRLTTLCNDVLDYSSLAYFKAF